MDKKSRLKSSIRIFHWFDPRKRDSGTWAFILNRLSAIGLTFYLFLHLIVLSKLAHSPEAYDSFLKLIKSPFFILGELLVVIAGIYHGLNGIRIVINSFGIVVKSQKLLFIIILIITLIISIVFAVRMF